MTVALVVGVGEVGTRAARQLVDTPGLRDGPARRPRRVARARSVADALGPSVHAIEYTPGDAIPPDVAVIACALPAGVGHDVVAAAIAAGVPVASSDDEHDALEQLRALDPNARVVGRHGRDRLRSRARPLRRARRARGRRCSRTSTRSASRAPVGPGPRASTPCATSAGCRCARGTTAAGARSSSHGDALVFFPEPIGGRDCRVVTGATALARRRVSRRAAARRAAR